MSMKFLMFIHEDVAVNLADIAYVRALNEDDKDTRTGEYKSSIPKGSQTLLWLRHGGYLYTQQPFGEVMNTLHLISHVEEAS